MILIISTSNITNFVEKGSLKDTPKCRTYIQTSDFQAKYKLYINKNANYHMKFELTQIEKDCHPSCQSFASFQTPLHKNATIVQQ